MHIVQHMVYWQASKGHKRPYFQIFFFLGNIGQENLFNDILERKNAFVSYIKQEVQKVEKLTFFQRG